MRHAPLRLIPLLALPILAIGCAEPGDSPATSATADPAAAVDTVEGNSPDVALPAAVWGPAHILSATPGTADCGAGSVIEFAWTVPGVPDTASVELWVGEGETAKLFAAGGPRDQVATGPWATSGTIFVLRDPADQSEHDRVVIAGPECPPDANATSEPLEATGS